MQTSRGKLEKEVLGIFRRFNARNRLIIMDEVKYSEQQLIRKLERSEGKAIKEILALINKEKAKAELAGRIDELDKAHTANSLGEWADYFLERRESLAQLAKGEDNHADQ